MMDSTGRNFGRLEVCHHSLTNLEQPQLLCCRHRELKALYRLFHCALQSEGQAMSWLCSISALQELQHTGTRCRISV